VTKPTTSFIIPVLNGERYITRCLLSIKNLQTSSDEYEIIIIDNGSTDRTPHIVRELGFELRMFPGVNVSVLRNHGASLAQGRYLAFVDADVEISPKWLQHGVVAFEDERIVAAGCFPGVPTPSTWVQRTWDMHQRSGFLQYGWRPVSWLPSMNLMVRRDTFCSIRGFNEQLETAEDVDLCYRLRRHGTIRYVADMEAIHWGEAPDLETFWRKEVWRGTGNLKGALSHGFRWEELPSLGYPLYSLCLSLLLCVSCIYDVTRGQITFVPINLSLLLLPASGLAVRTSYRSRGITALPALFLLYFIYGLARAYSFIKALFFNKK
jgi:glycosyltransferase involved in cell wall biosynthesis